MGTRADIEVHSPDGQLQLVVEVKAIEGATDSWAAELHRTLLSYGVPRAPYFLLVSPEYLYLWCGDREHEPGLAPYKVPTDKVLGPFMGKLDVRQISGPGLELVVVGWLSIVLASRLTREDAGPELQWLLDSGLYDSIKWGSMALEEAA